jgi:hypothetical protein
VACEAEKARLDAASAAHGSRAAYASMICASLGHNSIECQGAQGEAAAAFSQMLEAQRAYQDCLKNNPEPTPRLLGITGYVTFLLINEPGGGYGGGSTNWLDAEVIFKLHSRPDKGFGFQLRQDTAEPVRRGMLSLLEDALVNKLQVITDYIELPSLPNNNSFVIRVALTQTPPGSQLPPGLVNEAMS